MNQPTASDERRALALIEHHQRADTDGLNVILLEAVDKHRLWQLIVTVLLAYEGLIPALYTENQYGVDVLVEQVSNIAGGSVEPPTVATDLTDADLRAAAVLILEHTVRNGERVQQVAEQHPNVSALICAVMSLYSVLCPALGTHTAEHLLHTAALRAAELEAREGE